MGFKMCNIDAVTNGPFCGGDFSEEAIFAINETPSARKKRTLNHDRSRNPRQGAQKAAHGQRPFRGAAQATTSLDQEQYAQVGGFAGSSS